MNLLKNTKQKLDEISFNLYKSAQSDYKYYELIIEEYGLDVLLETENNGIITNLLNYFIFHDNKENVEKIYEMRDKLMKRDYLSLIKYYPERAEYIFDNYILSNIENIQSKDIDFLIDNNLHLLKKLDGVFINCNISASTYNEIEFCSSFDKVKLYNLSDNIIQTLLNKIEAELGKHLNKLNLFFDKLVHDNYNYNLIVDGGNVIHSDKGKVNINKLKLINKANKNEYNPLLIIHSKHSELKKIIELQDIPVYFTPYGYNDDLFILWFFLKMNATAFILSNDKYRDHVFMFKNEQFKNIIFQQTLKYNTVVKPENKPVYSNCIQVIDNQIFIPTSSNKFISMTF